MGLLGAMPQIDHEGCHNDAVSYALDSSQDNTGSCCCLPRHACPHHLPATHTHTSSQLHIFDVVQLLT